ncbi:MAG: IS66 family transposase [Burkholderiales bacterium]
MNYTDELAKFNPNPALLDWVLSRLEQQDLALSKRDAELQRVTLSLDAVTQDVCNLTAKNEWLTFELARLKRLKFAAKTEAMSKVQTDFFQETLDEDIAAIEAQLTPVQATTAAPKQKPRRSPTLPDNLERVDHLHDLDSRTCSTCSNTLVKIGEDITEKLDIIPAKFFVQRHIRPKYACRHCETVNMAPVPPTLIEGGIPTPAVVAWVVGQKYIDHLPLYRVEQISGRMGLPIPGSTLAEWTGKAGIALQPLINRLTELLLQRSVLHADETPVPMLDPGRGKTRKAYLWAYRNNSLDEGPPIIVFDFQTSRAGEHVRSFLHGWQGHLMVDDYGGYKKLFNGNVTELACWAHARRKFFDLHAANQHPVAEEALQRIGELYAIEKQAKDVTPEERQHLRATLVAPRIEAMFLWLQQKREGTPNGGALAKAIDYSIKRWDALRAYAHSGNLPIDNNQIENAIRPIAIGKKNWMFAGSESAGKRAANIQSLLATAKANGLDPMAWLIDTLEKLPAMLNKNIDELLPFKKIEVTK